MMPALLALVSEKIALAEGLTIERAIDLAIARNERSRTADQKLEIAEARLDRARAFFFPELSVRGNYTRRAEEVVREFQGQNITLLSANAVSAIAALKMTVFDARGFPLFHAADLERESAQLTRSETKRGLAFEAADAFLITLSMAQVVESSERRLGFARASVADARARFQAGLVSSNDVTRPELEMKAAEHDLLRARANLETAELELSHLLNTEVHGPFAEPNEILFAVSPSTPSDTTSGARSAIEAEPTRSDLEAMRIHSEALDAVASEPLLRIVPSIELSGEYRVTNEAGFSGRTSDAQIALNATWTLFDGGERYAEGREREAEAVIAHLDITKVEREIAREIKSAKIALTSAREATQLAKEAARTAHRNAEEIAVLYRQGLARALEVADANLQRFEREIASARERYGLLHAHLALRQALGRDPLRRDREVFP